MYDHSKERVQSSDEALDEKAHALYISFVESSGCSVKLNKLQTILPAYVNAKECGVFTLAEEVREYYFGRKLTTYGVVYVSDVCVEACKFCPAGRWNRNYKAQTLSDREVIAEILCVMLQGHRRVCVLQANWSEEMFLRRLERWLPEAIRVCVPFGLEELILNVQTLTEEGYNRIIAIRNSEDSDFALQVRTFQETYDQKLYEKLITSSNATKHNFMRRRATQEVAWKAGVEAVGLGVLFGLCPKPLQELQALVCHAGELLGQGVNVVRVCLPSAHEVDGLKTHIPYSMNVNSLEYLQLSELLYALARLALPGISWVMSERDPRYLRRVLARYATETTVGVRPGVGDNLAAFQARERGLHFVQTTTYSDDPVKYLNYMDRWGYAIDLDLSLERKERILEALISYRY